MTSVSGAVGPFFSIARKSLSGPARSSASNQPPTHSVAGLTFFMCGASARDLPELVVVSCLSMSFQ